MPSSNLYAGVLLLSVFNQFTNLAASNQLIELDRLEQKSLNPYETPTQKLHDLFGEAIIAETITVTKRESKFLNKWG